MFVVLLILRIFLAVGTQQPRREVVATTPQVGQWSDEARLSLQTRYADGKGAQLSLESRNEDKADEATERYSQGKRKTVAVTVHTEYSKDKVAAVKATATYSEGTVAAMKETEIYSSSEVRTANFSLALSKAIFNARASESVNPQIRTSSNPG